MVRAGNVTLQNASSLHPLIKPFLGAVEAPWNEHADRIGFYGCHLEAV